KDNTRQIIYELIEVNSIVNYVYEEKAGLSNARKHGANVDTEWVIYLDDDNLVSENWLSSTLDFILDNTEIGVFNCAIVGELDFQPNDNEKLIYQAFYKYLACSHENIEEYMKGLKPSFGGPVGAGMGLKVAPL